VTPRVNGGGPGTIPGPPPVSHVPRSRLPTCGSDGVTVPREWSCHRAATRFSVNRLGFRHSRA